MVAAIIFQFITVFWFIGIFFRDKQNQAIVSPKKRFWYSILFFCGTEFLLRLFLVKDSQIMVLFNIFGVYDPLLNFLEQVKKEGFIAVFLYLVDMPIFLFLHFPSFLIFWIQFSKNKKIKIKTTVLYLLWCAITIWLCVSVPDREQRAAQLRKMLEEKRIQEMRQKAENPTLEPTHSNAEQRADEATGENGADDKAAEH